MYICAKLIVNLLSTLLAGGLLRPRPVAVRRGIAILDQYNEDVSLGRNAASYAEFYLEQIHDFEESSGSKS